MGRKTPRRVDVFLHRDAGSTISEYAILAALIAIAVLAVVATLAGPVAEFFTSAGDGFEKGS